MLSTIICVLTAGKIRASLIAAGLTFIFGAAAYYILKDYEPKEPNKAEEKLRAKRLAEKGDDHE